MTSETVNAEKKADLQVKNFVKEMKPSRFSYQMREAKRVSMGREKFQAKYVVANPSPMSPMPELVEKEKLSLSNIGSVC